MEHAASLLAILLLVTAGGAVIVAWVRRPSPGDRRRSSRLTRLLTLVAAGAAAAGFAPVRNHFKLEDTPFLVALTAFCVCAALAAGTISLAHRDGLRRALGHASVAVLLVPVFYGAYLYGWYILGGLLFGADQS
jgi:peptidoglycan/LPS O-acetylase OafA/YrhL